MSSLATARQTHHPRLLRQRETGQKVRNRRPELARARPPCQPADAFLRAGRRRIRIDNIPSSLSRAKTYTRNSAWCCRIRLFEAQFAKNIVYSKQGVTDQEVKNACKTVGLHHFIKTLPNGYDTVLNDKASLSEGQKQLLTIARAMIQNAPLLILDEATSSVDTVRAHGAAGDGPVTAAEPRLSSRTGSPRLRTQTSSS
jgi:ATP-binding cassette subfamily B protein